MKEGGKEASLQALSLFTLCASSPCVAVALQDSGRGCTAPAPSTEMVALDSEAQPVAEQNSLGSTVVVVRVSEEALGTAWKHTTSNSTSAGLIQEAAADLEPELQEPPAWCGSSSKSRAFGVSVCYTVTRRAFNLASTKVKSM